METLCLAPDCVKVKGWKWLPGMRVRHISTPYRVVFVEEDEYLGETFTILKAYQEHDSGQGLCMIIVHNETFPDLEDLATGGALFLMLGDKSSLLTKIGDKWGAVGSEISYEFIGDAAAYVAISMGSWG